MFVALCTPTSVHSFFGVGLLSSRTLVRSNKKLIIYGMHGLLLIQIITDNIITILFFLGRAFESVEDKDKKYIKS